MFEHRTAGVVTPGRPIGPLVQQSIFVPRVTLI